MGSKQIKMEEGLHEEVKKFVDSSPRYSSYKGFYEAAVRDKLDKEKNNNSDLEDKIDQIVEEKLG